MFPPRVSEKAGDREVSQCARGTHSEHRVDHQHREEEDEVEDRDPEEGTGPSPPARRASPQQPHPKNTAPSAERSEQVNPVRDAEREEEERDREENREVAHDRVLRRVVAAHVGEHL